MIAIFGPTGVGKTAVAIALAELLRERGEDPVAVSADALQVYAGLGRLTGAPEAEELSRLEHRLIGYVALTASHSVGEYMPLAHAEIDAALAAGRRPIVVGGTGLYLRAALCDLDLRPRAPGELRERLARELEQSGVRALHARLAARAPPTADVIDARDSARVLRALELLEMGELRPPVPDTRSQLWTGDLRRPATLVGLVMDRRALYARIDRRVEAIVAVGARAEVHRADATGASPTARKALGFDELLRGDVDAMKRRSRNYAKRQLTWMRKLPGVRVLDVTDRAATDVAADVAAIAA